MVAKCSIYAGNIAFAKTANLDHDAPFKITKRIQSGFEERFSTPQSESKEHFLSIKLIVTESSAGPYRSIKKAARGPP